jgi:hypothetical protein
MKNRINAVLFVTVIILHGFMACSPKKQEAETAPSKNLGLSVAGDGTLLLEGKPYKAVGVNYFNAFSRTLEDGSWTDTSYRKGFRYLKARNIPFVRFMCSGFWPVNFKLYQHNKPQYFKNLDAFVKAAEELGIGLIPSLFWNHSTIPDLLGESVNQWGNPDSKTTAFMRQYVQEVVSRYKSSPAIWGWEYGNELNLVTDLPGDNDHLPQIAVEVGTPPTRSKADKLSTKDLQVALTEFGKAIRKYDTNRIIISGNANPRPGAYHLHTARNWDKDTQEQYAQMLDLQNPGPVNTISIHHYPDNALAFFADYPASLKEIIRITMEDAVRLKKPLFIGEFGAQETLLGTTVANANYTELIEGIAAYKVPLAAMWVFDYPPHDAENGINAGPDNGPREYMLQAIKALNERLQQQNN